MGNCVTLCIWLTLSASAVPMIAQWQELNGPFGAQITCMATNGSDVYAGTWGGGVFQSSDGGRHWTIPSIEHKSIVNAMVTMGDDLFVSFYEGVYRSTDNGATWTSLYPQTIRNKNRGVATNGSQIFVGNDSGVAYSINRGDTWTHCGEHIGSVDKIAVNGSTIYAGTYGGLHVSGDGGVTWDSMALAGHQILALASKGTRTFVTTAFNPGKVGHVFVSNDNGRKWDTCTIGLPAELFTSVYISDSEVFIGCTSGVYRSTDWGSTWRTTGSEIDSAHLHAYVPDRQRPNVRALVESDGNILAGSYSNGVFLSTDGGDHWSESNDGLNGAYLLDLAVSNTDIFALTSAGLQHSSDGGNTWTTRNFGLQQGFPNVVAVSDSALFVGVGESIYHSKNLGVDWIKAPRRFKEQITKLESNGADVFAASDDSLMRSRDHGLTWQDMTSIRGHGTAFTTHGNEAWLGNNWGEVWQSSDSGATWTRLGEFTSSSEVSAIGLIDGAVFMEASGETYRYIKGEVKVKSMEVHWTGGYGRSFVTADNVLFRAGTKGILATTNLGDLWKPTNQGLTDVNVTALDGNDTQLYAGTQSRGVWRRSIDEIQETISSVHSDEVSSCTSVTCRPNPCSNNTIIMANTCQPAFTTATLHDMHGREVCMVLADYLDAGDHAISIDVTNLLTGQYFLRLSQTGSFITQMLTVVK